MNVTLDTTVLAKGLIPPRRRKRDVIYEEQFRLHTIAKSMIGEVEAKESILYIPSVAIVEIAAVGARLTGEEEKGLHVSDFVREYGNIIHDVDFLDKSVIIASSTKISGFDSIFIACAQLTNSTLITDDRKMFDAAVKIGVSTMLLRDIK